MHSAVNEDTRPAVVSAEAAHAPNWGAVFAVAFGVAGLNAAEMLPVSLLTPIATDLHISEGMAGQTLSATAVTGLVTSLLVAVVSRDLDKRVLLLFLAGLQIASNLLVGIAPNMLVLMIGRVLLGISAGGFWALSASLTLRLVPATFVPRAFSIIFGGAGIATVIANPVGSYLGALIGWRGVFIAAGGLAAIGMAWQFFTLPQLPPIGRPRLATLFHVLKRPTVGRGMAAVTLVFAGHFAFFTYLRPFLETVTRVDVAALSAILLAFGIGSFLGTYLSGAMLERSVELTLLLMPLLMAVLSVLLIVFGSNPWLVSVLLVLWGIGFGSLGVGWSTWLTNTVPDEAESGGGILVATIQFAIMLGAAVGGAMFDRGGPAAAFGLSGALLFAAAIMVSRMASPQRNAMTKHR